MKNNSKIVKQSVEIAGKTLEFEVGRFAQQASAAVLGSYGDTMILATVVSGGKREDLNYFPLFVEYQEKLYAGGRIKGSRWVKREGRPSDEAILNARLVDRSIRPLFPKQYLNETQMIITVLSVDAENDPDIVAINTASAALSLSNIPWEGPVAAVRLGFVPKTKNSNQNQDSGQEEVENSKLELSAKLETGNGHFMVNPTYPERDHSDLDLIVSSTQEATIMVEAGANQVSEQTLIGAIEVSKKEADSIIKAIDQLVEKAGKEKLKLDKEPAESKIKNTVKKHIKNLLEDLETPDPKNPPSIDIASVSQAISEEEPEIEKSKINDLVFDLVKERIRKTILEKNKRPDGRSPDDIREINTQVDVLPRTHGSAIFKRGQTQALTITTLAGPSLEQWIETMEGEGTKRYIHHYYMPPYSVGEVGRLGWPSRREIGHGALAERALEPMIPSEDEFPYTIRVVSEILSSNGSTSMAAVCGSTLSLMDSGVPLQKPVAGIAMGLITNQEKKSNKLKKFVVLSDIQGLEDHIGDMDFKIAGTKDGITAIQMDVKIKGVSGELLKQALKQAHKGRLHILEKMSETLPAPRAQLSKYAPKVKIINIPQDQIGEVIGPGGKTIRQIIADTGASIDVDDDGRVTVSGTDSDSIRKASDWIESLTRKVEVGEEFEGTVKRIEPFGAFIEILPGKQGLVHVSKMAPGYVSDPNDIVSIGDKLNVVVSEIDNLGRINLRIPGVGSKSKKESKRRGRNPTRKNRTR